MLEKEAKEPATPGESEKITWATVPVSESMI